MEKKIRCWAAHWYGTWCHVYFFVFTQKNCKISFFYNYLEDALKTGVHLFIVYVDCKLLKINLHFVLSYLSGKPMARPRQSSKDVKAGGDQQSEKKTEEEDVEMKPDVESKKEAATASDVIKIEDGQGDDLPKITAIEKREKKKIKSKEGEDIKKEKKEGGDAVKKEKKESENVVKKEKKSGDGEKKEKKEDKGVKKEKKENSGEKSEEGSKVKSPEESPTKIRKRHSERRQEKISALQEKVKEALVDGIETMT